MNDGHLERLLGEIDRKLAQRLDDIGHGEHEEARQLEDHAKHQLQAEMDELRHAEGQRMARYHERAIRQANQSSRESLWQCQHACMDEVVRSIRNELTKKKGVKTWLKAWLPEARRRLADDADLELLVSPAWQKLAGDDAEEIPVRTVPMLGGAILRERSSGIEVDGSWERRLARLNTLLWQRWHESIGKHHQD
ncbi:MAG TPA: hypothetical protein VJ961_09625 [Mariprofundaceae bacterium]|nr:hypothetical protein [Mariprofundaceae bacterium]